MEISQTFSEKTKEEICHKEYDEECLKSIASSFLSNCLQISVNAKGQTWEIKTQYSFIIRFLDTIMHGLYILNKEISYTGISNLSKRRTYKLSIKGNFEQIISDLELLQEPKSILKSKKSRMAYLVGAFLSGGSISSIEKSHYHLEIRSGNLPYLRRLQEILNEFDISITLLKRKSTYVLYIKKSEDMSDFLKIIGAYNAMQTLEDKRINRDFNNQLYRLNNLDISNLKKSTLAGTKQCEMISEIQKNKAYKKHPKKFRIYCDIRNKNPEISLTEIAKIFKDKYKIKITRTGLNHYVSKIKILFIKKQTI